METLKIKIPKGYEVDSFDKLSGEIKFKAKVPQKITDRIKTVEDVVKEFGFSMAGFEEFTEGRSDDEKAYMILVRLAKVLNEGWEPDWSNSNEYKYYPWFEMKGSSGFRFLGNDSWGTFSLVGSRLCFKSRELAEYAGKQFEDVYRKFMVIN